MRSPGYQKKISDLCVPGRKKDQTQNGKTT
jgi:hypothetical protein